MILINNTTARITHFICSVLLLGVVASIWSSHTGGRAHNVAILSALVLRNENSVGCQRPEMTLSWCCATTTLGRGIVRSPEEEESVWSTVWDIRHSQWWITTPCEHSELQKPEHYHLRTSSWHQTCMHNDSILDFKFSPCFICNAFSFGYLPGIWVLKADVSEHFIGSIFIGRLMKYTSFGYLPGVWVLKADVSQHFNSSIFIGRYTSSTCLWSWNR